MALLSVNKDRCVRDGICVADCPMQIIETDTDGFPKGRRAAEQFCIKCGHCVSVCPCNALELTALPKTDFVPVDETLHVTPQAAVQFMKSRRSIRLYEPRPVPRETLLKVLDVARCAPTGTNRQPIQWIVFEQREQIVKLASLVAEPLRAIPYFKRMADEWDAGNDLIFRGAPHLVIALGLTAPYDPIVDGTIALSHLDLAAHAYGLGTCWAGVLSFAVAMDTKVQESLDIPEGYKYCGAMMLGYPQHEYPLIPPRNPLNIIWR